MSSVIYKKLEPHIRDGTIKIFMFKNPIQYGIPVNDWANKNGCKNFDT